MHAAIEAFRWFNADRVVALTAVLSLLGVAVAVKAAVISCKAAVAAEDQARAAEAQAVAAHEQVTVGREQTALLLRQLQQAEELEIRRREAELEALQPAVVVSVQQSRADPTVVVLVVENLGKTAARNVRITPSAELVRDGGERMHEWRIFTEATSVIPPGQRLQFLFAAAGFDLSGIPDAFEFAVDAEGPFGPLPMVTFSIDFAALTGIWVGEASLNSLIEAIKKTNSTLSEIKGAVKELDPEYKAWLRRGFGKPAPTTPDAGFP